MKKIDDKKDAAELPKHLRRPGSDSQRRTSGDDFSDIHDATGDPDECLFDPDHEAGSYFGRYPGRDKDKGRVATATTQKSKQVNFGLKPEQWVK